MRPATWLFTACLMTVATQASSSIAAEPFTGDTKSIVGAIQYGVLVGDAAANPYGLGLGAKVGVTLPSALYLGAFGEYFFGGTSGTSKASSFQLMIEGGYDMPLGPTTVLRPKLSAGLCVNDYGDDFGELESNASDQKFAVAPGVQLIFDAKPVLIALEGRFNIVLDDIVNGLVLGGGVGTTF